MFPVLLQFGSLGLRTFPLVFALAVLVGGKLTAAEFRRRGLEPALADNLLMPVALLGLLGARLLYVLVFDPAWYLSHPADLATLWNGGLAFQGALLAGLATALWVSRRKRVPFWRFADGAVPGVALGQAIGALGSFLNGSAYGTPTDLPWAVVFTDPRGQAPLGIPLHPTQLYEALGGLLLFTGLWTLRTRLRRDGSLFLLYLAGVSALACLDLLKGDALWIGDTVLAGPVVSLLILIGAASLRVRRPSTVPSGAAARPGVGPGLLR